MSNPIREELSEAVKPKVMALQIPIKALCDCQIGVLDMLITNTERSRDRWREIMTAVGCGDSERALYMIGELAAREVESAEQIIAAQNGLKAAVARAVAQSDGMEAQFPWLHSGA
jgi:hypothetical protein